MNKGERQRNIVTGVVMILTTIPFFVSTQLKADSLFLIPYFALAIMALSGLVTLVSALRMPNADTNEDTKKAQATVTNKEIIGSFAFLFLSIALMQIIGTYTTLFLLVFLSHLYISKRTGTFSLLRSLMFAIVADVIVVLVFHFMLGLRLPTDVLLF